MSSQGKQSAHQKRGQQQQRAAEAVERFEERKWGAAEDATGGGGEPTSELSVRQLTRERPQQHSTSARDKQQAYGVHQTNRQQLTSGPAAAGLPGPHRLTSSEILNENKQRQLKQQESFKKHLEQRQRELQESQQKMAPGDADLCDSSPYQVNTAVPDYMKAAAAAKQLVAGARSAAHKNPFDESAQVSGKSGFLSSLMGAPADGASGKEYAVTDESRQELDSASDQPACSGGGDQQQPVEPRYAKLAQEQYTRYTYDYSQKAASAGVPFYRKDLGTLLQECRASRSLVILIVAIALLLDNMLLTSVVPIIPAFLYKLRIERQHREELASSWSAATAASANNKGPQQQAAVDAMQQPGAKLDFERELERRINQSVAAARDRYSGSFFHPRLRPDAWQSRWPSGKPGAANQYDDDNEGTRANTRRRPDEDNDEDDRDDDDQDDDNRDRDNDADENSRRYRQHDDDDNDDEDDDGTRDDDDLDADDAANENQRKTGPSTKLPAPTGQQRRRKPRAASAPAGVPKLFVPPKRRQELDGPEESSAAEWNKFRRKLITLANDTDQLAGVCMQFVMGPDSPDRSPDGPTEASTKTGAAGPAKESASGGVKSRKQRPAKQKQAESRKKIPVSGPSEPTSSSTAAGSPMQAPADANSRKDTDGDDDDELVISHEDIVQESFEVGVMFASKPIVQAIANPFIGTLTNRVGFTIPMFTGFVIMFLSTLVFAFGSSYSTLFVARAIQGVGSACTSVAGMSMLADRFPDDAERGHAMSIALGGLAMGVVIGPPFGGFMYEFVGKSSPFIVLAILALADGLLQLLVLQPKVIKNPEEGASLMTLIKDPYILIAAGAITFANTGIAILEPALPLWMMDTMHAKNWEQGVAFLPAALSYMLGTNLFGTLGHRMGRSLAAMIGLLLIGCSLLLIPFATRVEHLIVPNGIIGFAMGMVDSTMMPMLGYLVDIRHTSVYGSVYAIGDVAFCASFAFGPALSGTLVELIGFEGLIITTAIICFGFSPLMLVLKREEERPDQLISSQEESRAVQEASLRYVNYEHLDSPEDDERSLEARKREPTYVR